MNNKEMGERMAIIETKIDALAETVEKAFKQQKEIDTNQNIRLDKLEEQNANQDKIAVKCYATRTQVDDLYNKLWIAAASIIGLLITILGFMIKYQFYR